MTANASPAPPVEVVRLLGTARAVFFDFDGPVCRVFAGYPAALIAAELKEIARKNQTRLRADWAESDDPHRILWAVRQDLSGEEPLDQDARQLIAELERVLTRRELTAVGSAEPVQGAVELVRALYDSGRPLMVTSNNAAEAVRAYLEQAGIDGLFDDVIGRDPTDPLLMKPNPHCVIRAVQGVGLRAEECLLLGDQPTDHEAAQAAGVPFLGYARNAGKEARLRGGGAEHVVTDMRAVLAALTG